MQPSRSKDKRSHTSTTLVHPTDMSISLAVPERQTFRSLTQRRSNIPSTPKTRRYSVRALKSTLSRARRSVARGSVATAQCREPTIPRRIALAPMLTAAPITRCRCTGTSSSARRACHTTFITAGCVTESSKCTKRSLATVSARVTQSGLENEEKKRKKEKLPLKKSHCF